MSELASVLDELAKDAPLERASWNDVLARAARGRSRRGRRRLGFLVASAIILALAGTAVGLNEGLLRQQERFHARAPDDPRRIGPLVEIVSAADWALFAWRSKVGICIDFAIPGNSPFVCGLPVRGQTAGAESSGAGPPTHAIAAFEIGHRLAGGEGKMTTIGLAAGDVARAEIELSDGRVLDAPLYDAPAELDVPLRFFIVRFSPPPPRADGRGSAVHFYSAYDGEGRLLERRRGGE